MTRPASTLRGPLTSVSALLVVGLLVGTSLRVVQPAVGQVHRDAGTDRAAVRQLTATLAAAVRDMVGSDRHKPALRSVRWVDSARGAAARVVTAGGVPAPERMLLRTELLDLPPPAARA